MTLNTKIKALRLSQNLTQVFMAEELGIDVTNYSRLERGDSKVTTERLTKIAKILDVSIKELLNEDDNSEEEMTSLVLLKEILNEMKAINNKLK